MLNYTKCSLKITKKIIKFINSVWYKKPISIIACAFSPASFIYNIIIIIRKYLYKIKLFKTIKLPVPVIVVGNITVGGTGKTPFVIWLAKFLENKGYRVGIISRGYKAKNCDYRPKEVFDTSSYKDVGDEPVLIKMNAKCPVVVCRDRVSAAQYLLKNHDCNIIISDDGLQHYRMHRDLEIILFDEKQLTGNGLCLPAGPLREPASRIKSDDFVLFTTTNMINNKNTEKMFLKPLCFKKIINFTEEISLENLLKINKNIHAVAGIGNPKRFFKTLVDLGFNIIEHDYPDHYDFQKQDIDFCSDAVVVMTEKDAVKCINFANNNHYFLQVSAECSTRFSDRLIRKIKSFC